MANILKEVSMSIMLELVCLSGEALYVSPLLAGLGGGGGSRVIYCGIK